MSRIVRCSLIQASIAVPATEPLAVQKQAMIEKHLALIRQAAADGAQIVAGISKTGAFRAKLKNNRLIVGEGNFETPPAATSN